jgi:hypothetical protein
MMKILASSTLPSITGQSWPCRSEEVLGQEVISHQVNRSYFSTWNGKGNLPQWLCSERKNAAESLVDIRQNVALFEKALKKCDILSNLYLSNFPEFTGFKGDLSWHAICTVAVARPV